MIGNNAGRLITDMKQTVKMIFALGIFFS